MTELYTLEMAEKDFNGSNGLELSLQKWESIRDALDEAGNAANDGCGLCLESHVSIPYSVCQGCPYYKHHGHSCGSAVYEVTSPIRTALDRTRKVIRLLRQVEDEKNSS